MVSVNRTPAGSVDGPLFVIVIVYVVGVPAVTVAEPSVLVSSRSPYAVTVLLLFAVLFATAGSFGDAALTVAVLTYVPPGVVVLAVTFTVITHAGAPDAIEATMQVTTLATFPQLPVGELALFTVYCDGTVSDTVRPMAVDGPALLTVRV